MGDFEYQQLEIELEFVCWSFAEIITSAKVLPNLRKTPK